MCMHACVTFCNFLNFLEILQGVLGIFMRFEATFGRVLDWVEYHAHSKEARGSNSGSLMHFVALYNRAHLSNFSPRSFLGSHLSLPGQS